MSRAAIGAGRFAPSPSGDLHIGNIRSGLLAYARARQTGRRFLWRIEDLDRVRAGSAESQLAVFAELGVVPDEPPLVQSTRHEHYAEAIRHLDVAGLVYECYCSRRDIQQAPSAPHAPPGAYPGTCRSLGEEERAVQRDRLAAAGRSPALRLRAENLEVTIDDALLGPVTAVVDDLVLRRGDGVFAYNLTVVVDDAASGVDEVVRGDDLASSAPRQAHLARLLGLPMPGWVHVPLVLSPTGARLAKRDGAVTYQQLKGLGWSPEDVFAWVCESLGFGPAAGERPWRGVDDMVDGLDLDRMVREPTVFRPPSAPCPR
ncbi:glutamyl-tRNA synthetase [Brevibacterium sanguinis]|uniref:Glutamyl-tRNA synthetase n=2 Tax=Brevibacterium TaxID=1696 RepID=A0A366IL91_9MICO|nr:MULTISPECIES: tRNA glutamyl-Q(34) synthetase GluQRS [Brevibacterium]RBP64180.1 glutamyl-tRNA synthetase [Brevibacterium sanguinis]RBP71528.1 glutamyl-tRNA synthetase [Brevibacterium celere]